MNIVTAADTKTLPVAKASCVRSVPLLAISLPAFSTVVFADSPPETIAAAMPGTKIESTAATVIDGLVEVVAGENVLYVDKTGRYLVVGSIYDLHEDRDLSAERRAEVRAVSAPVGEVHSVTATLALPVDAAITTGDGSRSLTVITDPLCGWCRRMWVESLNNIENVKISHLLLYDSAQARGILCANDPGEALSQAFKVSATTAKTPVPSQQCSREAAAKINRVLRFAESAGMLGTPILIREDGEMHAGYLGRSELLNWLGGNTDDT